jgi:hypothetical protein
MEIRVAKEGELEAGRLGVGVLSVDFGPRPVA